MSSERTRDRTRPPRRVVILTGDGPAQRFVVNTLCDSIDVVGIVVERRSRQPLASRIARWRSRYSVGQCVSKAMRVLLLRAVADARSLEQALERECGCTMTRAWVRQDRVFEVGGVSSQEASTIVQGLKPDVLLVFGCGMVSEELLRCAGEARLNMHTGLSPWYRGTHCAFWPIAEMRWDMVGVTIHECTNDVDGGAIHDQVRVVVKQGDTIHDVFARCVRVGAERYARVAQLAASGMLGSGTAQRDPIGRVRMAAERGIGAELRARWNLRRMRRDVSCASMQINIAEQSVEPALHDTPTSA